MILIELINHEQFFWFCALFGSAFFVLLWILNLMGIGCESAEISDVQVDELSKIKWISLQGLAGFSMIFGWTALTCQRQFAVDGAAKIVISLMTGSIMLFLATQFVHLIKKLHSPGTVFEVGKAVGMDALVYQRISAKNIGKVTVCIDNFTREIDALSYAEIELNAFTKVKIIKKIDDKTVLVVAI